MNAAADALLQEDTEKNHFRVAIFGSARIKEGDNWYNEVFSLSKAIAKQEIDIITGGGPGIMQAANAGHHAGRKDNSTHSIGMTIRLPKEDEANDYLDIRKHFQRFSNRLDHFMALSHVVLVMPGGIGTCLELFYTWQLTQVKHMCKIPIILRGEIWEGLIEWVKSQPLEKGFMSPEDMDNIFIVKTNEEALEIIHKYHQKFANPKDKDCVKKYTLQAISEMD